MSFPEDSASHARDSTVATLADIAPSTYARVLELHAARDDAARLKALGLCSGRRVQLVQQGDPLILRAVGIRIGVSRRLAKCVTVEPIEGAETVKSTAASEDAVTKGVGDR